MSKYIDLGPLITAMVTPFSHDGGVDYPLAIEIGNYLIENGSTSILLSGTTGESPTLTHEEEFELYRIMVKGMRGRVPIIVGTGSNCTRTAVASTQEAERLGVDASLQVVPYYNKPSQEGLFQHFRLIAQQTNLPIILYNIPGRTSASLEIDTIKRLSEISNIIGIKEASGSVDLMEEIRSITPSDFDLYSGDDALLLPALKVGAKGVVSVASHVAGKQMMALIKAKHAGELTKAGQLDAALQPLYKALFMTTNPVPVKAAMRLLGFSVGAPRLPLVDVTESEYLAIESVLDSFLLNNPVPE